MFKINLTGRDSTIHIRVIKVTTYTKEIIANLSKTIKQGKTTKIENAKNMFKFSFINHFYVQFNPFAFFLK